jgi:hypothetical protein
MAISFLLTSKPVSGYIDSKPEISVKKRKLSRDFGGLFPKWPFPTLFHIQHENKSQKSGMFLAPRRVVSSVHVNHTIHHKFTSKTPHQNTHFSQNPLQKHSKTAHPHLLPE